MTTVGEVMKRNLLTVDPHLSLHDAAARMSERGVGAALVISNDHVAGILTERDVLRAVATGGVDGTHVAAWMTRDPETVDVSESTGQAAAVMIHGGFRHLPVLDGGKPVRIVSTGALVPFVVDEETPRGFKLPSGPRCSWTVRGRAPSRARRSRPTRRRRER